MTSGRSTNWMTAGTPLSGRRWDRAGKHLQAIGASQYAASFTSLPTNEKIWMPGTKADMDLHAPGRDKKLKYDYRPKSTSARGALRDANTMNLYARKGEQTEHWLRRPHRGGRYSQPTVSDIHYHRVSENRKGKAKMAGGTILRSAGKLIMIGSLVQYGSWIYKDPSQETMKAIVMDVLTLGGILQPMENDIQSGKTFKSTKPVDIATGIGGIQHDFFETFNW